MSKLAVTGACRKGSVGPTGSDRMGLEPLPLPHSDPMTNQQLPFPFFLFSLSPLGISHQLKSKDISCHNDEGSFTFALGCGHIGVAVSLPVEHTSAGRACSSCCGNVPPMRPSLPSPTSALFSSSLHLLLP